MTITAEQVEQEVKARNIKKWNLRECSACAYPLAYLFEDGKV